MKWSIPAKTFLLGEYAALAGASAILLTTSPCFELTLTSQMELSGIHPESPAGLLWAQQRSLKNGLLWSDPYAGCGGLGASSAQFLSTYLACCLIENKSAYLEELLHSYDALSWTGKGLKPSGYDVIAQLQQGCVYINKQKNIIESSNWPFQDLSFFLIHTGFKLPTHHHLQETPLPANIDYLSFLVENAKQAFERADSRELIIVINKYHKELSELNLVAEPSLNLINQFKEYSEILALKGCGALGADVLLILTSKSKASILSRKIRKKKWTILATEKNIYLHSPLLSA